MQPGGSWIQAAEIRFLQRVAGLRHRDRMRSSGSRFGYLVRISSGFLPGEVFCSCPVERRSWSTDDMRQELHFPSSPGIPCVFPKRGLMRWLESLCFGPRPSHGTVHNRIFDHEWFVQEWQKEYLFSFLPGGTLLLSFACWTWKILFHWTLDPHVSLPSLNHLPLSMFKP